MSSKWTHAQCDACWVKQNPGRIPVRVAEDKVYSVVCCSCSQLAAAGIYVRADPLKLWCNGTVGYHAPKRTHAEGSR